MDHRVLDTIKLEFLDQSWLASKLIFLHATLVMPFGFSPLISVKLKIHRDWQLEDLICVLGLSQSGFRKNNKFFTYLSRQLMLGLLKIFPCPLNILGYELGFRTIELQKLLTFHYFRSLYWLVLTYITFLILVFLGVIPFFTYYFSLFPLSGYDPIVQTSIVLLVIVIVIAFLIIGSRLIFRFIDKYFVESLCVKDAIYFFFDLKGDQSLSRTDKKMLLLSRIRRLAKTTHMLATRYASDDKENQFWLSNHFFEMENYIRERERWIIAPKPTTLQNLENDFYELIYIFISGNYGNFQWRNATHPRIPKSNRMQRIFRSGIRLTGFAIPLIILGGYLLNPNFFPFISIDPSIITLIFIAWLLLTIDITLKLGVAAEVTNIARGIKELG
jgi:hypothetical protein